MRPLTDDVKKKWEKDDEEANTGWVNYDSGGRRTTSNRSIPDSQIRWTTEGPPPGSPFHTGSSKQKQSKQKKLDAKAAEAEIDSLRGRMPYMGEKAKEEARERIVHLLSLIEESSPASSRLSKIRRLFRH